MLGLQEGDGFSGVGLREAVYLNEKNFAVFAAWEWEESFWGVASRRADRGNEDVIGSGKIDGEESLSNS